MSIKETCNKCGSEVIEDRKLDDRVWNCPNCGLEEYQSQNSSIQTTMEDKCGGVIFAWSSEITARIDGTELFL